MSFAFTLTAHADDDFEQPPIEYSKSEPCNVISELQQKIDRGDERLTFDNDRGYLPSLLKLLGVPVESQMLVFSKTSLQLRRISPRTPRAIYFNDEVYVGYCQSGDVLEISSADPQLGTVFYTLDQKEKGAPRFVRQTENCLVCHGSSRTEGVPGHVARSVFVDTSGQPILSAGSHTIDYRTPLEDRWGGWYVTGTHGTQKHQGNLIIRTEEVPRSPDNSRGMNVTDLSNKLDVSRYLVPHSDIIALMVLEHQIVVHNRITKAHFTAEEALAYEKDINRAFGEPEGNKLESTTRRIQSAGNDLVKALLCVDEARLTTAIKGTSGYAEKFARQGLRDKRGRSLKDLDLERRLFKYPCSYLIYSPSIDSLPSEMKEYVWRRLWSILGEGKTEKGFEHLTKDDRQAIVEILRETRKGLPTYWF
ncbi:hypothetical protein K2Y11_18895 [bacterium]|nr:hypothetical protein [bacterium]